MADRTWGTFPLKIVTTMREGYSHPGHGRMQRPGRPWPSSPDKGLITAIVAGFLVLALGGSRVQIGGPTGVFVMVVFNVIAQHRYGGLILATLLEGIILIVAGFRRRPCSLYQTCHLAHRIAAMRRSTGIVANVVKLSATA